MFSHVRRNVRLTAEGPCSPRRFLPFKRCPECPRVFLVLEECFWCLSNGSKGINLASTRIGSRSNWHGVPKKETSTCLKIRLDRLEKGIHVFLRTSRKEFPSFKGFHDRARRRKRWPNRWPKYVQQTNIYNIYIIYIYIYIYIYTPEA